VYEVPSTSFKTEYNPSATKYAGRILKERNVKNDFQFGFFTTLDVTKYPESRKKRATPNPPELVNGARKVGTIFWNKWPTTTEIVARIRIKSSELLRFMFLSSRTV
jgi:hypothetical protein